MFKDTQEWAARVEGRATPVSVPANQRIGWVVGEFAEHPAIRWRFGAYARMRGIRPVEATVEGKYDLVWLSQSADYTAWSRYPRSSAKLIVDLCDDYLSEPAFTPRDTTRELGKFVLRQHRHLHFSFHNVVEAMCRRADAVVVGSDIQRERVKPFCPRVVKILDIHSDSLGSRKNDYRAGKVVHIGWEGFPALENLAAIMPVLRAFAERQKIALHIVTLGKQFRFRDHFATDVRRKLGKVCRGVPFYLYDWTSAMTSRILTGCDLAIIPLDLSSKFNVGKPANKLLLYWQMGVPVLTSALPSYQAEMKECGAVTCCGNQTEWRAMLERFATNESLRRDTANRAFDYVDRKYAESEIALQWDQLVTDLGASRPRGRLQQQSMDLAGPKLESSFKETVMLFAPGPVEMEESICRIAARPSLPYFRGAVFAETVKSVSQQVKYLFQTASLPLPITASGTGLMEMAVTNLLDPGDTALVINGGSFGQKWVDICRAFDVKVIECKAELGKSPDLNALSEMLKANVDAVLVNMHETSTGYLYDIEELGSMARSRGALLIVDGVSSIGADPFRMDDWHVDCAMVSTQKALALLPGLGYIAFSDRAAERMARVKRKRYYFDAPKYILNLQRGMTPFTPAMASLLQLEERMKQIVALGLDRWIGGHAERARCFRERLLRSSSEYAIFPERSSNALTAVLLPEDVSSGAIIEFMREKYDWWFAPAPTSACDRYLRVSHMGNVDREQLEEVVVRLEAAVDSIRGKGKSS